MKFLRTSITILIIAVLSSFSVSSVSESHNSPITITNIDKKGCTYWITKRSHKRHNSSCRWYKNSNGYCTDDPEEGIACKICGG